MTNALEISQSRAVRFWTMLLAVGVILQATIVRSQAPTPTVAQSADTKSKRIVKASVGPGPACPSTHFALRSSPRMGHHKVILSWTASTFSTPESKPVGYCVYRRDKQNVAKQDPTCSDCVRINSPPFPGTACVDDLVQDGGRYYYVVMAINAKGKPSSPSDEVRAEIPSNKKVSSVPMGDYPPCRGATESK